MGLRVRSVRQHITFILNAIGAKGPKSAPPPEASAEEVADTLIVAHDGNSRAAVVALVSIVQSLKEENRVLRGAASPGFARRRPPVLGAPS